MKFDEKVKKRNTFIMEKLSFKILIFLIIVTIVSSLVNKVKSGKVENKENKFLLKNGFLAVTAEELEKEDESIAKNSDVPATAGLMRFARRIFENDSISNYKATCDDPKNCRDVYEQIAIGYDRSKKVSKLVSFEECRKNLESDDCKKAVKDNIQAYKSVYLIGKSLKTQKDEISKFILGFTPHQFNDVTSEEFGDTYLFKICVPVNKEEKYFVDFRCPHDDCPKSYEISKEVKFCSDQTQNVKPKESTVK